MVLLIFLLISLYFQLNLCCNITINVNNDIQLKDALICAQNNITNIILISSNIQSTETFLITNINNLYIKNDDNNNNVEKYYISVRTKRIFNIIDSSFIIFDSLLLRGTSVGGGIIISNSTVSFLNIMIYPENIVPGSIIGGGIKAENNSKIEIINSTITSWKVNGGGAIHISDSQLNISNSILTKNFVTNSGGAIYMTSYCKLFISESTQFISNSATINGGGIYTTEKNEIIIHNTIFLNNTAGRNSGGLYISSIDTEPTILHMKNIELNRNSAGTYSGGILISNTIANFEDVTCLRNYGAIAGGCISILQGSIINATRLIGNFNILANALPSSIGGVIFITNGGNFYCTDCLFYSNFAGNGGVIGNLGGNIYFYDSYFTSNSANSGGVYYSQNTEITIKISHFINCIFKDNIGKTLGGVFDVESSILHVNNSLFNGNILSSTSDNRGGILSSSNSTCIIYNTKIIESYAAVGGALYCAQYSKINLLDVIFFNVYSTNNGGVIRTEYNTYMSINNVTFNNCSTIGNGGVMNIQASTIVIVENSLFLNCYSNGLGGNIYITTKSFVTFINSTFKYGYALGSGGCIGSNDANINLIDSLFFYCQSSSGGAIYLQSSYLKSYNTLFLNNRADQGGSVLGDADTEINLNNDIFHNNSAIYKGGSILITGGSLFITNTLFNNSYCDYGGAIHASVGARIILLKSIFTYNIATYEGGAILLQSGKNSYLNNTFFGYNYANTAAVLYQTNSHLNVWNCEFKYNEAYESAGVMAIVQDSETIINDSKFYHNYGYLGGVFYIDDSKVNIHYSDFYHNSGNSKLVLEFDLDFNLNLKTLANGFGGIFYSFFGIIEYDHCIFRQNYAYIGGVGWMQLSKINSYSNEYYYNQAYNGGVYSVSEQNIFNSTNDIYGSNFAEFEGTIVFGTNFGLVLFNSNIFRDITAIYTASLALNQGIAYFNNCWFNGTGFLLFSRVTVEMYSSRITNILSLSGGSIQVIGNSITKFINTSFISNIGSILGGAISYKNSYNNSIDNCLFEYNKAKGGAGIESISASIIITNSIFRYNKAIETGGGIFWTESNIILENNTFYNNTATYGPDYATTPKGLYIVNPNDFLISQNSGYELLNGIQIIAIDYYDQYIHLSDYLDIIPYSAIIVAQTTDQYSSISGITIQSLDPIIGYTIFSNLTVTLSPLSNVTLEFSIQGSSKIESAYLNINFRDCEPGEIKTSISNVQAICLKCKEGYYSFDPTDTICTPCPSNANCPGGNIIDVNEGYWRQCQYCHDIKQCKTKNACSGGTNTSTQCKNGYEGPLCDVCSNGYFNDGQGRCVSCGKGTSYIELIFAFIISIIIAIIFLFWKKKEWIQEKFENLAVKVDEALEKYELKAYLTKMKILIGFLQILVNIPEVLAVVFPKSFSFFVNSLNLINLNFFRVFATQCYYNENFYTDLLLSTILPPAVIIIIDIILRIKYRIALRLNETQPFYTYKQKNIDRRIIFLIIAFFVFSPVSITIFQTFVCEKFEDGKSYLVADYSVECHNKIHKQYSLYAGFMIILYPIGIPLYYIYHLARKQEFINPPTSLVVRQDERNIVSALVIQDKKIELRSEYEGIKDISFLYDSYLPKCWYFEIVECFRRIALTALPVLFLRSTIIQVVLVLIVSLGFSALYMEMRPFVKNSDNVVAIVSQWALSLTFLGTLCFKIDMTDDDTVTSKSYLGVILSLLNGFTIILTFYLVIVTSDEDDKNSNNSNNNNNNNNENNNNDLSKENINDNIDKITNIKIQDINYEYDSDDDSLMTVDGKKKFPSVELEKTKANKSNNTEIRSLKEYQRRASIKQQLIEQEQSQLKEQEQEQGQGNDNNNTNNNNIKKRKDSVTMNPIFNQNDNNNNNNNDNEPKMRRRASSRRTSIKPNPTDKFVSNRSSEVEDIQIYRYSSASSNSNSNNNNINNNNNNDDGLNESSNNNSNNTNNNNTQNRKKSITTTQSRRPSFLVGLFSSSPIDQSESNTNATTNPTSTSSTILTNDDNLPRRHRIESTPDSDDEV